MSSQSLKGGVDLEGQLCPCFLGACPTQDEAVSPYHKLDIGDFVHRCMSQIGRGVLSGNASRVWSEASLENPPIDSLPLNMTINE